MPVDINLDTGLEHSAVVPGLMPDPEKTELELKAERKREEWKKRVAEAELKVAEMKAKTREKQIARLPTGRHDPNPYDDSPASSALREREEQIRVANERVLHLRGATFEFAYMPLDIAVQLAGYGCGMFGLERVESHDDWNDAIRRPDFMEHMLFKKHVHDLKVTQLRVSQQNAQNQIEDRETALLIERGEIPPAPEPVKLQYSSTRKAKKLMFTNKLITEFAHHKTRTFLQGHGWYTSISEMVFAYRMNGRITCDEEEECLEKFLTKCEANTKRSRELLFSVLSPEQRFTAINDDYFDVLGSHGNYYRVRMWAPHQNVHLLDPDTKQPVMRLCGYLADTPIYCTHVMQLLTLQQDEVQFLRQANESYLEAPANDGYGLGPFGLPAEHVDSHVGDINWTLSMIQPRSERVLLIMGDAAELESEEAALDRRAFGQGWWEMARGTYELAEAILD